MPAEDNLVMHAARLARHAPEQWSAFIDALAGYTNYQTTNCVRAPLDILPVAQGRAQQCALLYEALADCLAGSAKIEGRTKK
jgi:hypothetical protein